MASNMAVVLHLDRTVDYHRNYRRIRVAYVLFSANFTEQARFEFGYH